MKNTYQEPAHVRVGAIVIRCYEFERMVQFWQAALHYVVGWVDQGFVILHDPSGKGPNLSLD
ncbi:MAG: VOC family protein [Chloroflexi bacterium AL-W]|nr:VOC family protein [Chloroflexi bacterium AL-N1]NOK67559.1 VOC family protein [Chloroflexi bacterium AL-N10]NOK75671.1 VOC family protein [Chloroflexi bacterium AL-N5]NOK82459.1 VOC family protein [Chloroflexi bacterium AL-W]NOK90304.1 VOC family protein [Chloroflexi bacterium AL-N15]